jgi:hypothetical protein
MMTIIKGVINLVASFFRTTSDGSTRTTGAGDTRVTSTQ